MQLDNIDYTPEDWETSIFCTDDEMGSSLRRMEIQIKLGLGRATNSKVGLLALWATLKIAKDKQIDKLNIYGYSKTMIEWAQGRNSIRAPHLLNLIRAIRSL